MKKTDGKMRTRLAFLSMNIGSMPIGTIVSSFLSIYYVSVLGMDEMSVGTMFLLARIFDGVNDPFIGYFIDHAKESKFGKFRRIFIMGAFLYVINTILLWVGPAYVGDALKLMVAYVTYFILGVTFPIMDISLNSMLPVITDDSKERDSLAVFKMVGYGIGMVLTGVVSPIMISSMGADKRAYINTVLIFSAVALCFALTGVAFIRQTVNAASSTSSYSLRDLPTFLLVKPVLVTFIAGLLYAINANAVGTANSFFATYALGDIDKLTILTIASYPAMVLALFVPALAEKIGKKPIYGIGLIVCGVGVLFRILGLCDDSLLLPTAIISSAVSGLGTGLSLILFYAIQADNTDYIDYSVGKRAEGAISSLSSMVTKIGSGVGGALPLYILGWTKLSDGSYSMMGLMLSDCVFPAVMCIMAGIIFMAFYQLDKKECERFHAELEERRKNQE